MKIAVFDTHRYDRDALEAANAGFGHELAFFEPRLTAQTAGLAKGFPVVCSFVNDKLDAAALKVLHGDGVRLIALRCAGFNHVDLPAAEALGIAVARVPAYSPHAVAEHAVALILALNRKIHRSYNRVRESNFSLDGLVGFDLHGKTAGVVGVGRIGKCAANILHGFGCRLLGYDPTPDSGFAETVAMRMASVDEILADSDIVTLHVPLTPGTRHMINAAAFAKMKPGAMLVNTSRGGLIDAKSLVKALKDGRIGSCALDVYEEEEGVFFQDHSDKGLQDDVLARLLTFPNVLITSHQAFLTREALHNIAETTLSNVRAFERREDLVNRVRPAAK